MISHDSHYIIGSSHKYCEDYAVSGVYNNLFKKDIHYGIISDGCSASKNSGLGAAVLVKSAESMLEEVHNDNYIKIFLYLAEETLFRLSVNQDALDATLLMVWAEDKDFYIKAFGDGAIIKLFKNGDIEHTVIEYPSGAPFYLNYTLNNNRLEDLKSQFGIKKTVKSYYNGMLVNQIDDVEGCGYFESGTFDDIAAVFVTSDGLLSFAKQEVRETSKEFISLRTFDIIKRIINFKNFKGEFIKRRLSFFEKEIVSEAICHFDDLSIAGIYKNEN